MAETFGARVRRVGLFHRQRFAGERGLDDEQVLRRNQPHIAGNHVAGGELDDVAGHELRSGISFGCPSRTTVAVTLIIALSLAAALSALVSWTNRRDDSQNHHQQHHRAGAQIAGGEGDRRQQRSAESPADCATASQSRCSQPCRASWATSFGPNTSNRSAASSSVKPLGEVLSR